MKESAQAALSYVRAHARELGVDDEYFQKNDIHIHVPAGAIPKDGPSAGVTMATAICSLVTGTPISSEVAMTGEVTLTGQVLPIGGLKEKTLAAQRAGIHTVILPTRNQVDLEDVPENLRADMTFVPVDRVEQVWEAAMGLHASTAVAPAARSPRRTSCSRRRRGCSTRLARRRPPGAPRRPATAQRRPPAKKRPRPATKKGAGKGPAKPGMKKPAGKGPAKPGAKKLGRQGPAKAGAGEPAASERPPGPRSRRRT